MYSFKLFLLASSCVICQAAFAQEASKFVVREEKDDISTKLRRSIVLTAEDKESLLSFSVTEGRSPTLTISPERTIHPDDTDIGAKLMTVAVSLRSTAMDAPITRKWSMAWMSYGAAGTTFLPEEIEKILGGEAVTIQFDKLARRYKFVTAGAGFETLSDEVKKCLELTPTPEEDKARVDALMKEHNISTAPRRPQEDAEVAEARREGEKFGRSMKAISGPGLKEHEARGRAKSTADRTGFKKVSDPRRKAFVEGYMSQFPEFERGR